MATHASLPARGEVSGPQAGGDVALFLPHRIGRDRRRGELRVAEPALDEVERHAFFDTSDAKAMPQSFGTGLRPRDAGACHHLDDAGVGRLPAPRPGLCPRGTVAAAMHQTE